MIQEIADALVQSWRNFATEFVQFVPRFVAASIILTGGFLLSLLIRRIVQRMLVWLQFDRMARRTGASEMLRAAELPSAEVLIAQIVFWLVWMAEYDAAAVALKRTMRRSPSWSNSSERTRPFIAEGWTACIPRVARKPMPG